MIGGVSYQKIYDNPLSKNKNKNKPISNKDKDISPHFKLTKKDYIEILNFYINKENKENKKTIKENPNKKKELFNYKHSLTSLKSETEKIIAEKLCRCIKKVDKRIINEPRAIGICNNSVIKRKKLRIYKFTCKKKPQINIKNKSRKNSDKIYKNTRDHIYLNKTK
tara:strand:+ start:314 stop:811 length:498 start_codon:yes stop_codon:yes gene_type:complete